MIRVIVCGAAGQMGRQVLAAVTGAEDMELVGGVSPRHAGQDLGEFAGLGPLGISAAAQLEPELESKRPDAIVDFTHAGAALENTRAALRHGVRAVVGTTGFSHSELDDLAARSQEATVGVVVAPNFAIGAVLLMRFAREAARFFPAAEIVEYHHDKKKDAPSGTAISTADGIVAGRGSEQAAGPLGEVQKIAGARGGARGGVPIHSVRLAGFVAHEEVIFGLPGQTLTLRHDSIHRESFMPGVLLAVRRVMQLDGFLFGLEPLLFDGAGSSVASPTPHA